MENYLLFMFEEDGDNEKLYVGEIWVAHFVIEDITMGS